MEFGDVAVRFCQVIESVETYDRDEFVIAILPLLTDLLAAGAAMPPVELPEDSADDDHDSSRLSHEAWLERFKAVGAVLRAWDIYWVVDPLAIDDGKPDPEILAGDLCDDLADIWRDLKSGLLALDEGAPEVEVQWEWRWGFYNHWGSHATSALTVLHARRCTMYNRPQADPGHTGAHAVPCPTQRHRWSRKRTPR